MVAGKAEEVESVAETSQMSSAMVAALWNVLNMLFGENVGL